MSKTIYALGFFDGVHIGHTQLLLQCHSLAFQQKARAGVVTFGNHPDKLVMGAEPGLINTLSDRERLLRRNGIQEVVVFLGSHCRGSISSRAALIINPRESLTRVTA